ncbi:MAG: hypothetical protein SFY69_02410 [Planctomycetota bacterium]|nr:hypothetical protein [Planctomycetota bacterium]
MSPLAAIVTLLAIAAAVVLGIVFIAYVFVPLLKGAGWLIRHVFRFVAGEVTDVARLIGALFLAVFYVPVILLNIVIGRWSAAGHFGRALTNEGRALGMCLYRIVLAHPARLLGVSGLVEGFERRLPAAMAEAPTADAPAGRASRFEGYTIVGSLAPGGSGAKLYIADVTSEKRRVLAKAGIEVPGQVVLKCFSLREGSSLPQIVRESRSLDAAKKLGLILDHELTNEQFFYAMRYVPGESLAGMTKVLHASSPSGGLGEAQMRSALSYVSDLVGTLAVYHRGGLWHKDVKPDNVIIDRDGRAHLVDFGLVSSLRSAMTLTTHGTEYFRDPEMVRLALKGVKVHEVDGTKFDIYGAGAVLYAVVEDSFPAHGVLSQVTRRCPESVRWIIRRAMSDYQQRYPSAEAMLADLEAVRTALDPFAVRPADLPSVRGNFGPGAGFGAEERMPGESPFPPTPGAVPPAPMPVVETPGAPAPGAGVGAPGEGQRRTAPAIRVVDWWTGRSEIGGAGRARPVEPKGGATPVGVPAGAVWPGAPMGAPVGAPMGAPVVAAVAASPDPGRARRSAEAQIAAAKARRDARRGRAAHRPVGGTPPKVWNAGVMAALLIFVGNVIGWSVVLATRDADESDAGVAIAAPELPPGLRGDVERAVHAGWVASLAGDDAPTILATSDELDGTNVLIVSDLREPLSDDVRRRLTVTSAAMVDAGACVRGDVPAGVEACDGEIDVVILLASLRARVGLTPLDTADAARSITAWLSERDDVDVVVWFAPAPGPAPANGAERGGIPGVQPRVHVFTDDGPGASIASETSGVAVRHGRRESPRRTGGRAKAAHAGSR